MSYELLSEMLSSKLMRYRSPQREDSGWILLHWCPGCNESHIIDIEKPNHLGAIWTWDGNVYEPTINPSINYVGKCHYHLHSGVIKYQTDCKHSLNGQSVALPDIPHSVLSFYFGEVY